MCNCTKLACNGNFTNADSKRPLQNRWNQIVKRGSAIKKGVVSAASFVLNNPKSRSCDITKPIIIRTCTSGQKEAPLSYF